MRALHLRVLPAERCSAFSAAIGVIRTALSAGRSEPATDITRARPTTVAIVAGSPGSTPKSSVLMPRAAASAPATPGTIPSAASRIPSAKIMRPTVDGSAPSARRTAISWDRCDTV